MTELTDGKKEFWEALKTPTQGSCRTCRYDCVVHHGYWEEKRAAGQTCANCKNLGGYNYSGWVFDNYKNRVTDDE